MSVSLGADTVLNDPVFSVAVTAEVPGSTGVSGDRYLRYRYIRKAVISESRLSYFFLGYWFRCWLM